MAGQERTRTVVRLYLALFLLVILFGLHTVVFVESETALMAEYVGKGTMVETIWPGFSAWIEHLHTAFALTYTSFPVVAYCMDWLAYVCIVLAIFVLGAIRDPVRNIWIVKAFIIGCALAFLLPLIMGPVRGIPVFWRWIDSSFGALGFLFLLLPYRLIRRLEANECHRTHG